jgi:hypothetical protein
MTVRDAIDTRVVIQLFAAQFIVARFSLFTLHPAPVADFLSLDACFSACLAYLRGVV